MKNEQIINILKDVESRSTEKHIKDRLISLISELRSGVRDVLPEGPSDQDILDKMKKIEEEILS